MRATTQEAGYEIKRYKTENPEGEEIVLKIEHINLGIFEKEQPDIAIQNDIAEINVSFKGYNHTYYYSARNKYIQKNAEGKLILEGEGGYDNKLDGFSVGVKTDGYKYGYKNMGYTREIYRSYVNYTALGKSDGLKMYVTYKITIANQSTGLNVLVKDIVDYYDSAHLIAQNGSGGKIVGNLNCEIEPQKTYQTSITFEVSQDAIKDLLNGGFTIDNVVEISSYSVKKDGEYYAGIDTDSAPGNADPYKEDTYEDDTDKAPGLTIMQAGTNDRNGTKLVSGTVFEDYTDSNLKTNQERRGNGKYGSEDTGTAKDVTVELVEYTNGTETTAKIYPSPGTEIDATDITDQDGVYEFIGLVPGKYKLKYTYKDGTTIYSDVGQKEVTVQDYKSTIITSNTIKNNLNSNNYTFWYLNTDGYSVAVDDWATRQNINSKFSTINYNLQTNYYNKEQNYYEEYKKMSAISPGIEIAIENEQRQTAGNETQQHEYNNINFGIVERPRGSVKLEKEISHITLKLSNGQILIDGDPRTETLQHLIYPEQGILKIELDNELIQGASLEVTYTIRVNNKSEIDYNNENYYKFGENKTNLVTLKINKIVDYLDEKLVASSYEDYVKENPVANKWYHITPTDLLNKQDSTNNPTEDRNRNYLSDEVYNTVKNKSKIYLANEMASLSIINPDTSKEIEFTATKLLTSSTNDDDLTFENDTEIIQYSNDVGRFYETYDATSNDNVRKKITPGNYNPSEEGREENQETDSNYDNYPHSTITITPPTGKQMQNVVLYPIIGVIALAIIGVGVIIIKKKVL